MSSPVSEIEVPTPQPSGAIAETMAQVLADALLPGDAPLAPEPLARAAAFVLHAAATRQSGQPGIAFETVAAAAGERFMRIAVVNDDMPFLVDSVAGAVAAEGPGIDRLVHAVVSTRRDAAGRLLTLANEGEGTRESLIYIETGRLDARARNRLARVLEGALGDVRAAVDDWPEMRAAMVRDAKNIADGGKARDAEGAALLRWFESGMLTQLGHVVRRRDGTLEDALGLCRRDARAILAAESYVRAFRWFDREESASLLVVKSNRISPVHRHAPLDLFLVPLRRGGTVEAISVHAGLWTSAALASPPDEVPILRVRLAAISQRLGFDPRGHAGKALVHAFTVLPHDILVSFSQGDIERIVTLMMSVTDRPRPRLALVCAPLDRHLFAFVWLPRDTMSTATRVQIQSLIAAACDAPMLDWALSVEGALAQLRFVFDLRQGCAVTDEASLDAQIQALVRGWADAVEAELARLASESGTPARAAALAARYADGFPLAYRVAQGPAEAARDILRLRGLAGPGGGPGRAKDGRFRAVRFHRLAVDGEDRVRLKAYQHSGSLELSDAVPALENFGFRVIEDVPTQLVASTGPIGAIHDFLLALPRGIDAPVIEARLGPLEAALTAVANGRAEDDAFNRLVTVVGLTSREADWLRAFYRYLRQAGLSYGIATVVAALEGAPEVTRGLVDLFRARHDPDLADRAAAESAAQRAITAGLARVGAINDDRVLRRFQALVGAILRTNAFTAAAGELAFKIDSALVPGLPAPVPWREIFVCSRRVEGIHLRAGRIARGGIRWSDRRDDFRTEVLGLMKAQRVKNAVIVPTGAKGGFYPKRLPDPAQSRDAWLAEGLESYKAFIRALLSLTDNIVGGKVVHPAGIVVRDGDDPYFVVAADKGTASFSDTANAIAAEFDFWLDDAFASGGSKGYDHKAMGITARGAWLSVQRHFHDLGVDVQADPVTVAGCGDMSGDVFGNGMLLSKTLKLVAVFDHRHIFLDPAPDPARSWEERARLFALSRSSWDDYDKALLSDGGGVFARSQKQIPLSPQVRAMLGIADETIEPDRLIAAILRAPVDLMWFGGIGTYVKASGESHADVGDPANDALRVDGADVRARVIGEGANLGCTQAGRIEYALRGGEGAGGRNNTDFIDNSAGVDCSDKEVNIKIALANALRAGRLTEEARVALLARMTGDVAALVLEDNRLQALALSIAEAGGVAAVPAHARLIDLLVESGHLDRQSERLADAETLGRRALEQRGLTRPELAVILSSAKLSLQAALESSVLPDDPLMETELLAAFPAGMRETFREDILAHRLRREIVATRLANRIINRLGVVHPFELTEEEGATGAQVTAAYFAAEHLFALEPLWHAIEQADMPEDARIMLFERAASAARMHTADLLRAGGGTLTPSRLVADLGPGIASLNDEARELVSSQAGSEPSRVRADLLAGGAPDALAERVAHLAAMDGAVGIAGLAKDIAVPPDDLVGMFAAMGRQLGLDWAQAAATRMNPSDPWERLLVAGLARDFQQMRLEFLRRVVAPADSGDSDALAVAMDRWLADQAPAIAQLRAMVGRARAALVPGPAMLAQIASQARNLLAR